MQTPDNPYLLLTPGPLSTSKTVRAAMSRDWCTWDRDYNEIVQRIRKGLEALASPLGTYTSVLMQGSGTFSVEAAMWTFLHRGSKILVLSNGAYGKRMARIVSMAGFDNTVLAWEEREQPDPVAVERVLRKDAAITHIGMVHCETTTGMLNRCEPIARLAESYGKIFMLDAMSSFAGVPMNLEEPRVHVLISSANKCIQGVPGFGFVLARRDVMAASEGQSKSHSLDLYDQWKTMEEQQGKWRFTSPTHTVRAFLQAMAELEEEGGVAARHARYKRNHTALVQGMEQNGFTPFLNEQDRSPIITAFYSPGGAFEFQRLYGLLKAEGFVIYPGKVSKAETFRIGSIGHVFPEDFERLAGVVEKVRFW